MLIKDSLGKELAVGDMVAYATGNGVKKGVIEKITGLGNISIRKSEEQDTADKASGRWNGSNAVTVIGKSEMIMKI